ncbi:MAG: repeat family protein [Sedimentibacter sp.]|jgi:predicted phosphodiesterase|nr:repeat family protein [Sedimentibacter sp.]
MFKIITPALISLIIVHVLTLNSISQNDTPLKNVTSYSSDVKFLSDTTNTVPKSDFQGDSNIEIPLLLNDGFKNIDGDPLSMLIQDDGWIYIKGKIKIVHTNHNDDNVIIAHILQPRFTMGNKIQYQISSFNFTDTDDGDNSEPDFLNFGIVKYINIKYPEKTFDYEVQLKKVNSNYNLILNGKGIKSLEPGAELNFDLRCYTKYFDKEIVYDQIDKKLSGINKENFNLIFTSDIHYITLDSRVSEGIKLLEKVKSKANLPVVCTGDLVDQTCLIIPNADRNNHIESIKQIKKLVGSNLLWCKGNHDDNSLQDRSINTVVKEQELRELLLKDVKAPGLQINISSKGLYYYADNPKKKIRLIFLNTHENDYSVVNNLIKENTGSAGFINQDQIEFLVDEALDFSSKGEDRVNWHTCFFSHYPFNFPGTKVYGGEVCLNGDQMWSVIRAFKNGTDVTIPAKNNANSTHGLKYVNKNFKEQGPMAVAGCFYGHYHNDQLQVRDGITLVSTEAFTSRRANAEWKQSSRNIYSCHEFSFDIVSIDKASRTVTLTRIGNDKNKDRNYKY